MAPVQRPTFPTILWSDTDSPVPLGSSVPLSTVECEKNHPPAVDRQVGLLGASKTTSIGSPRIAAKAEGPQRSSPAKGCGRGASGNQPPPPAPSGGGLSSPPT